MHPLDRRRQGRIDPGRLVRIAAGFDKGANGVRRLGLAQQDAMHPATKDLAELPGVEAHIGGIGTVDRSLDDDGRRAVPGGSWAGLDQTLHVFSKTRHVERAVLHPDVYIVGPGIRVRAPLCAGQYMTAMTADIIDRLVACQQFDGAVDAVRHDRLLDAGFAIRGAAAVQPTRTSEPPSTGSATPVMKLASSDARKRAALATSQAVPMRPRSGTLASRSAATSARLRLLARARVSTAIGVSIRPGRIQLARMP